MSDTMTDALRPCITAICALAIVSGCATAPKPPPDLPGFCADAVAMGWDTRRVMLDGVIYENPCGVDV